MEEIAYMINNVGLQSLIQYGVWAIIPLMLRFYAEKAVAWKKEIDEKLVVIDNLQKSHEIMSKQLDTHLNAYNERTRIIDNKIEDICTATERKNQSILSRLDATETTIGIVKDGGLAVLSDRLQQSITFFLHQGYTDQLARQNIHRLYTTYHEHGGNSWISEIYEKYKRLPSEEDYFKEHGGKNDK